jgi:hypothetical protein
MTMLDVSMNDLVARQLADGCSGKRETQFRASGAGGGVSKELEEQ